MEVLILTIFVSVALVVVELVFFAWNIHHGSHDHAERLSLLPLASDARALGLRAPQEGKKSHGD